MPEKDWVWLCEFCYRKDNNQIPPKDWILVWQCAVCPDCQERVNRDGGYAVVKCGSYATTPDPRATKN